MSFGIYKQGQGYWTRIMSAIGGGLLIAGGAAWLWQELSVVRVPRLWTVTLPEAGALGSLAPGAAVNVLNGAGDRIGGGTVREVLDGGSKIVLGGITDDPTVSEVAQLAAGSTTAMIGSPQTQALFEVTYLQGAAAGLLMLIGAIMVYWLVYLKRGTSDFLIATEGEMRKVNWSTRREVLGSTWVVIAISVIIAAILFIVDIGFSTFFTKIGVLESTG